MALYAIGDLHLSLGTNKPMDIFGGGWEGYTEKLSEGFNGLRDDDICILCGDLSWGLTLGESLPDFLFIENLPGKKIILKGNHDYWWNTVTKMNAFFEANNIKSISILHNNCYITGNTAVCGTRGWLPDDELSAAENAKIAAREALRLRASLQAAEKTGTGADKTCFFHFPPRFSNTVCREFVSIMDEFGVKNCYYGHLHGNGHRGAVRGCIDGINYDIISADFLGFKPLKLT